MKSIDQIIFPIAAELQQFEAFFGQTLKAETDPMNSIMRYVLDSQGKRLARFWFCFRQNFSASTIRDAMTDLTYFCANREQ